MKAALVAALLAATVGSALAADPLVLDPTGDCALPHGNAYLDVVSAWIDGETADAFTVNLELASFTAEPAAEGAAYAVEFEHGGAPGGVAAVFAVPLGGWQFYVGAVSEGTDTLDEARDGSFDGSVLRVEYPKSRLPGTNETTLDAFVAMSADLRTAYPFLALGEDVDGRWLVCDEATGDRAYTMTVPRTDPNRTLAIAEPGSEPVMSAGEDGGRAGNAEKATPGAALPLLAAAIALATFGAPRRKP